MPTTHHHAILCGVSLHIVRFEVVVRKVGVGTLGVGDAVGVSLSEDSLREVLAGLSLDFAALDRELLAALVAVGSHFALGDVGWRITCSITSAVWGKNFASAQKVM